MQQSRRPPVDRGEVQPRSESLALEHSENQFVPQVYKRQGFAIGFSPLHRQATRAITRRPTRPGENAAIERKAHPSIPRGYCTLNVQSNPFRTGLLSRSLPHLDAIMTRRSLPRMVSALLVAGAFGSCTR